MAQRAFINVYPAGKVTGGEPHVDHMKYCSVIVGIEESEVDGEICPLMVNGKPVRLSAGMIATLGRPKPQRLNGFTATRVVWYTPFES
jgi:hypothetical protein